MRVRDLEARTLTNLDPTALWEKNVSNTFKSPQNLPVKCHYYILFYSFLPCYLARAFLLVLNLQIFPEIWRKAPREGPQLQVDGSPGHLLMGHRDLVCKAEAAGRVLGVCLVGWFFWLVGFWLVGWLGGWAGLGDHHLQSDRTMMGDVLWVKDMKLLQIAAVCFGFFGFCQYGGFSQYTCLAQSHLQHDDR